jgi:2,3-bisphosphoglycerate-independent phosphoglycerate mutase
MPKAPKRPVVLCVLDGWGHRSERADNAVALARTPNFDRWFARHPHALLDASELEVGLPPQQMGNSEVGHMNLGAGRVVMQDLPRVNAAVADGSLARNPHLLAFLGALRKSGGAAHILGLVSPGGVHSHADQILALVRLIASAGIPVLVHAWLDGRDTPPSSALEIMRAFQAEISKLGAGIATVGGRYYGMDRDKRWERVAQAYQVHVDGGAAGAADALTAIEDSYRAGVTDEFVRPIAIGDYAGMRDGDGLVCANFRADRVRQILTAFLDPAFDKFARARRVRFAAALGMVEYSAALAGLMPALFAPERVTQSLGELLSKRGLKQLRIAETEKYAHVTFFFNGGEETVFPGEERILVPSPKVATYDLQPEMSAPEVTDKLVAAIDSGRFDFILVNYANTDMVGHTGILRAAIEAVETVDACLGRVAEAVERAGGALLVTSDHGNAETMRDAETGEPHTAHTMNRVPLLLLGAPDWVTGLESGRLADVAPSVLALMGIAQPKEMTGRCLLREAAQAGLSGSGRAAQ